MAGRGGRGAAIMEALLARQRQASERNGSETADEQREAVSPTPSVASSAGLGRGRAALIASFSQQRAKVNEPTPVEDAKPQPTISRGRGRAQLFQALLQNKSMQGSSSPVSPPPQEEKVESYGSRTVQPIRSPTSSDVTSITKRMGHVSLQDKPPVHRTGESGKQFRATANYIKLFLEPGKGVFEYEVQFNPQVDSQALRHRMLNQHTESLGGAKTFDGVVLYLPIRLKNQETFFKSTHPADGSDYTLKIIFKRQKRLGECTHLYNVLFRRIMQELRLVLFGRQHYDPSGAHQIPQHKLEVWPGYVTAVDEYEGGIQLCCDASHRVLRTQTVHEIMEECVHADRRNYKNMVEKAVVGMSVLTRYNNRMYRVDDIDWNQTPSSSFNSSTGAKVTYEDYYKKSYNLKINDLRQPMLINRKKLKRSGRETVEELICLVPELCYLTGLTDTMRSDFRVMKDIAMYTRITPNQRQYALRKFVSNIQSCEKAQAMLAGWGLRIDGSTVSLTGRVLDPENIIFRDNETHRGTIQADWGAATARNKVLVAVDLLRWIVVHAPRDKRYANDFVGMMRKIGPPIGITIYDPKVICLQDEHTDSYLRALRESITESLQLVVILFPTARDDRYCAVKKLCCADMPVASQVINSRTLSKPDKVRSVLHKIALQINCKLGGSLWAVKIPMDKLMVCGIDSYHEAKKRSSSVAAFVASTNQSLTRWYSKACFQGPGQELVDGLKTCFIAALNMYYKENHYYPEKIVIYRDGVGDGQLNVSAEYEVPQFESCFRHVSPDYHPKLTVIVCQKRINTRIFAMLREGGDGNLENPHPGSIVDHTITRRNWYDFFLVSQHVRQGTVSPTHYVVIHDSSNMKTDHVQRLTYKLCHLYYNWPGTIRVPAPCQYAHKLAQLVGLNIRRQPSELLANKLYFL